MIEVNAENYTRQKKVLELIQENRTQIDSMARNYPVIFEGNWVFRVVKDETELQAYIDELTAALKDYEEKININSNDESWFTGKRQSA